MGDETKIIRRSGALSALLAGLLLFAPPAAANPISGVAKILFGVLQVPFSTLAGTFGGPPIVGTVFGALHGIVQGISLVGNGALELAGDGIAVAKAAAPFVLPFVL